MNAAWMIHTSKTAWCVATPRSCTLMSTTSPLNHPLIEATLASDACLSPYGHPPSFGWQRKLVKLSKHDPDSDVWEADEWAESLELLLEEGLLPGMPQEGF